jgi:hypothetical protein
MMVYEAERLPDDGHIRGDSVPLAFLQGIHMNGQGVIPVIDPLIKYNLLHDQGFLPFH